MEDLGRPVTPEEVEALKRKSKFEPYRTSSRERDGHDSTDADERRRMRRSRDNKKSKPRGKGRKRRRSPRNDEF